MAIDNFICVGIITGLTQLVKTYIPSKYVPLTAIIIAVIITSIYGSMGFLATWQEWFLIGLLNGLSAIGLYSGVKNTIDG